MDTAAMDANAIDKEAGVMISKLGLNEQAPGSPDTQTTSAALDRAVSTDDSTAAWPAAVVSGQESEGVAIPTAPPCSPHDAVVAVKNTYTQIEPHAKQAMTQVHEVASVAMAALKEWLKQLSPLLDNLKPFLAQLQPVGAAIQLKAAEITEQVREAAAPVLKPMEPYIDAATARIELTSQAVKEFAVTMEPHVKKTGEMIKTGATVAAQLVLEWIEKMKPLVAAGAAVAMAALQDWAKQMEPLLLKAHAALQSHAAAAAVMLQEWSAQVAVAVKDWLVQAPPLMEKIGAEAKANAVVAAVALQEWSKVAMTAAAEYTKQAMPMVISMGEQVIAKAEDLAKPLEPALAQAVAAIQPHTMAAEAAFKLWFAEVTMCFCMPFSGQLETKPAIEQATSKP